MTLPMFTGSDGKRSVTLTLAVIGFTGVMLKYMVAGIAIGHFSFGGYPDAALSGLILGTTLGTYLGRRNEIGTPAAVVAARQEEGQS